jgi:hypothetical protein
MGKSMHRPPFYSFAFASAFLGASPPASAAALSTKTSLANAGAAKSGLGVANPSPTSGALH